MGRVYASSADFRWRPAYEVCEVYAASYNCQLNQLRNESPALRTQFENDGNVRIAHENATAILDPRAFSGTDPNWLASI